MKWHGDRAPVKVSQELGMRRAARGHKEGEGEGLMVMVQLGILVAMVFT